MAHVAPRVCLIDPFIQRQLLSGLSVTFDAISRGSNEAVWSPQLHSCCEASVAVCVNMTYEAAATHASYNQQKNACDNTLHFHLSSVLLFWISVAQRGKTDIFERVGNNSVEICPALPHKKTRNEGASNLPSRSQGETLRTSFSTEESSAGSSETQGRGDDFY